MFEAKFESLSIEDINFKGAEPLYEAFSALRYNNNKKLSVILNNVMDSVRLESILFLIPRSGRDRLNFYYDYDGEDVSGEGNYISLQPSWKKKKLAIGSAMYVNLYTGEGKNIDLCSIDEKITSVGLWQEGDLEKRSRNLSEFKEFIKNHELRCLA